jgi:hypothetical protein
VTTTKVARRSVAEDLLSILASPEVSRLIDELQATRETGRPGYPLRAMIGMALAKSLYSLPTWTRAVALVSEHSALAAVIASDGDVPSVYATASRPSCATTHICWKGASLAYSRS